jgi:thiamine pyrophosphokinase
MIIWKPTFIKSASVGDRKRALVILNQPFSASLFKRVWNSCEWHCCADGGANRLYDIFESPDLTDSRELSVHLYEPEFLARVQ